MDHDSSETTDLFPFPKRDIGKDRPDADEVF